MKYKTPLRPKRITQKYMSRYKIARLPSLSRTKINLSEIFWEINFMCKTCESNQRTIWTFRKIPKEPELSKLPEIAVVNWMHLRQCDECQKLWVEVPYEPYAMFNIFIQWPYSKDAFLAVSAIENALVLHEWHGLYLRENWHKLSDEDQKAINQWRQRTAGQFNPIDKDFRRDPHRHVVKLTDIEKFIPSAGSWFFKAVVLKKMKKIRL